MGKVTGTIKLIEWPQPKGLNLFFFYVMAIQKNKRVIRGFRIGCGCMGWPG